MSIEVKHITKSYGQQKAVDNASFVIPKGQTCGFLGPNGAGKSTLMKIMTGYLKPDVGQVVIQDLAIDEHPILAKEKIGYLPEHNPLYTSMYVKEFLDFNAKLYPKKIKKQRIEAVIDMVGLGPESHKRISALSKGYKQRLGLAQAILHDPEVLILDEPLNGLDPNQLAEIRDLIIALGKEKTVLFSSHILQEVEQVASRILLIQEGKLIHDSEVEAKQRPSLYIKFLDQLTIDLKEELKSLSHSRFQKNEVIMDDASIELKKQVFQLAVKYNNPLVQVYDKNQDLTELFQTKTKAE